MSALALVGLAAALGAGQETPTFEARVSLVTVDAVVVGADGEPMAGLPQGAFQILEDGVAQPVVSFSAIGGAPMVRAEAVAVPGAAAAAAPTPARTFALVFDDEHLTKPQAERVKAALASFLTKHAEPGDVIALFAPSNQVSRVTRLPEGRTALLALVAKLRGFARREGSPPRVSEQEAYEMEVHRDQRVEDALVVRFLAYDPQPSDKDVEGARLMVRARAAEVHAYASQARAETLGLLERTLGWLGSLPGRRVLVLASAGFAYDETEQRLRSLAAASLLANAPIHLLDARGLESAHPFKDVEFEAGSSVRESATSLAERLSAAAGADSLALDSGGIVVRNANDLEAGLRRVAATARVYYLLGYQPPAGRREGRFRKIEVRVSLPGARVRARRGYFGG